MGVKVANHLQNELRRCDREELKAATGRWPVLLRVYVFGAHSLQSSRSRCARSRRLRK